MLRRCDWSMSNQQMVEYHDTEWGVQQHDDTMLFEFLVLEGAQAGLSWSTILRRREGYRKAFASFDPKKVARYGEREVQRLLKDDGIIRNRLKIHSTIKNARAFIEVQNEFGSFDSYIWRFTKGRQIRNRWSSVRQIPATSPESDAMSRDLKKRGFSFVGSTICYAHMQATGMVNDHITSCFRYRKC